MATRFNGFSKKNESRGSVQEYALHRQRIGAGKEGKHSR